MDASTFQVIRTILARHFADFPADVIIAALNNALDANMEHRLIPCMVRLQKFAACQFNAYCIESAYCANLSGMICAIDTFLNRMPRDVVMREYAPPPNPYTGVCPYIPTLTLGCSGISAQPRVEKRGRPCSLDSHEDADTSLNKAMDTDTETDTYPRVYASISAGSDTNALGPAAKRQRLWSP